MAAGFFMALAVPDAFQDGAAWFAVAYFVVRVLNTTLYTWGVRNDPGTCGVASARAVVPRRGARRARRRLRRPATTARWVWLASLVDRRRRDAHRRSRRMARLAVPLRRALRAHRDHRARRVDRRDRDRDVGPRARHDLRALGRRRVRGCRRALVGVLRLHRGRGGARAAARLTARRAGRSRATSSRTSTTRSCSGSSSTRSPRRRRSSIRSTRSRRPGAGRSGSGSPSSSRASSWRASASFAESPGNVLRPAPLALVLALALAGTDAIVTLAVVIGVLVVSICVGDRAAPRDPRRASRSAG